MNKLPSVNERIAELRLQLASARKQMMTANSNNLPRIKACAERLESIIKFAEQVQRIVDRADMLRPVSKAS